MPLRRGLRRIGRLPFISSMALDAAALTCVQHFGPVFPLHQPKGALDGVLLAAAAVSLLAGALAMVARSLDLALSPVLWAIPLLFLGLVVGFQPAQPLGPWFRQALVGCFGMVGALLAVWPGRVPAIAPEKTLVL